MGFFDNLFGKKKEEKKEDKKDAKKPAQQQPAKPAPVSKGAKPIPDENEWIYELILQYLVSPVWKVTISEFLDEHCIGFDDEEENKFVYYDIHKKFKKMMEQLVDGMIAECGVSEDQFAEVVERGLKSQKHRKYFEQLLVIDNFLVFKKLMIKRNKENELEAFKEMQKQDALRAQQQGGGFVAAAPEHGQAIRKLELEKEKAELEHALAMSKAVEDERKKLLQDEEAQLQEALRQSELEYKRQVMLTREQQEEQQRLAMLQKQQQQGQHHQPGQMAPKQPDTPTPVQQSNIVQQKDQMVKPHGEEEQVVVFDDEPANSQPSLLQFYGQQQRQEVRNVQAEKVQEQPLSIKKKATKLQPLQSQNSQIQSQLPPIGGQQQQPPSLIGFDKDEQSTIQDRNVIQAQIDRIKQQQVEQQKVEQQDMLESTEDRKKRLMQQRELIRKKKQAESEKQLQNYQEEQKKQLEQVDDKKEVSEFIEQQKKASTDLERRKALLEQKKKQMLMNKLKEDVNYQEDLL